MPLHVWTVALRQNGLECDVENSCLSSTSEYWSNLLYCFFFSRLTSFWFLVSSLRERRGSAWIWFYRNACAWTNWRKQGSLHVG